VTTDGLPHVYRGKVRDVYDAGEGRLLMVTSDRLSAFDVVMAEPIPDKGRVLTAMSSFWFEQFDGVVGSHLVSTSLDDLPEAWRRPEWEGRIMLCRKAEMLPIECIVRGYITGSAWKEYSRNGTMHGEDLPGGLLESSKLPEPVFTPSTKADEGHDENISFEAASALIGNELAEQVRDVSLELYTRGSEWAAERGIIIADTKFEFGLDADGRLHLIDEVLTPDSSRFWPADQYRPGTSPPSFDKQFVRDYLETLDWNKKAPGPRLPPDVIRRTTEKYRQALELLTA
jgi:phosphoribosylaminoimidazole-succinocarboxamide synthase